MQHLESQPISIVLPEDAPAGVRRVAAKLATDFERVSGTSAVLKTGNETDPIPDSGSRIIVKNPGSESEITGKSQIFQITKPDTETLVISGSDLLGTIYGLYAISEYIGVSPLHYWGDVAPVQRDVIIFDDDVIQTSRQPSVKYRGLFINDEWPCFGTWTFQKFGGFTAEMYDHVFDLILRLRGNYLWPAMWTSSFALDGPGDLNEVLADEYGITVGASHHEPLLRASEEWDKVRGIDTSYGNDWNYLTNKQGLLNYWQDAMERSGHLNKLIMLGIRGERDSELLGEDATLQANVDLLKDAITEQRRIIAKADTGGRNNPQMLALYKEVEEYYYGSDTVPGLRGWDELNAGEHGPQVTLMFCEDNFGFMRSLPETDLEKISAGMYYHFDYHGGPISYEWMPSTSFERVHDQMSLAYDYGVKDVWVVNVGDLKFNEVPLAFFMAMAYDMDTYGSSNPNAVAEYTEKWLKQTFPAAAPEVQTQIGQVLHGYLRLNAMRRPEALNESIYHPTHYGEADKVHELALRLEFLNNEIEQQLDEKTLLAYRSLIGIPVRASSNLVQMHTNAATNRSLAENGLPVANHWADLVSDNITRDNLINEEIATFAGGKWFGHHQEHHIGFTTWNEDGNKYPLRYQVEPVHQPRLLVVRLDRDELLHKTYGPPMTLVVDDFEYAGQSEVSVQVANGGVGEVEFTVTWGEDLPWLTVNTLSQGVDADETTDNRSGLVKDVIAVVLTCDRSKLTSELQTAELLISDGETKVKVLVSARLAPGEIPGIADSDPQSRVHLALPGDIFVIEAPGFASNSPSDDGATWQVVKLGGREGDAIRVEPKTANFTSPSAKETNGSSRNLGKGPEVSYKALIEKPGNYTIELWQVPTGAVVRGTPLEFTCTITGPNCETQTHVITAIPADVDAGNPAEPRWAIPVLDNIRKVAGEVELSAGVNEFTIGAIQPNLMIEKLLLYPTAQPPLPSYLGPAASPVMKG